MPKRKLPPDQDVIKMYESGMSTGEIAECYSVSPVTVVSAFRRMGYRLRSSSDAAKLRVARGRADPPRYWEGKKQPPDMVEKRISKIRGPKHYLWKGGVSRRQYRDSITKVSCEGCTARSNLGIHHINFDHYDNRPENLQVLCVSCHMSLHKRAYWEAIHNDEDPPVSNGPIGWDRE